MRKCLAVLLFYFITSTIYSQFLQIIPFEDGYAFYVDKRKYTLPEYDEIIFRAFDENKVCVFGFGGDAESFYEPSFFTKTKGRYELVIYIKPGRVLIREKIEIK